MTDPWLLVLAGLGFSCMLMAVLWLWEVKHSDASIVDAGWAGIVAVLAVLYAVLAEGAVERRFLAALLGGGWALRLTVHLLRDRVIGKEEDGRYQYLRSYWGAAAHRKFFFFFQAQAGASVLFSLPMLALSMDRRVHFGLFDLIGALIWLMAVIGENIADRQLASFRAVPENKGITCRVGLWRYSRHPNYFFEWLHWWSYPALTWGGDYWWLSIWAPFLMLFLLLKVSGIPYTEARALRSRADYADYQRATNAFFPWFPKRTDNNARA